MLIQSSASRPPVPSCTPSVRFIEMESLLCFAGMGMGQPPPACPSVSHTTLKRCWRRERAGRLREPPPENAKHMRGTDVISTLPFHKEFFHDPVPVPQSQQSPPRPVQKLASPWEKEPQLHRESS